MNWVLTLLGFLLHWKLVKHGTNTVHIWLHHDVDEVVLLQWMDLIGSMFTDGWVVVKQPHRGDIPQFCEHHPA